MIRKNCKNCGKFYWSLESKNRKYCSNECHGKYRTKINTVDCKCLECGKEFTIKKSLKKRDRGKFCSEKCRNISMKNRVTVVCCNCGKKVEKRRSNAEKAKQNFCSLPCAYEHREDKVTVECNQCGKKFKDVECKNRKYCSSKCYQKSKKLYPNTLEMRILIKQRNKTESMHDTYIKRLLTWNNCLKPNDIPQSIVEAKRQNLKIKRLIRNKDQ